MISFLLASAGFLNLMFYVFAIGCAISFVLEQFVKDNERSLYIVQTNSEVQDEGNVHAHNDDTVIDGPKK